MRLIRNFSIIAHVDHGKSTLADRFIQHCGGLSEREMANQVLDSMDLERERGITIKAQSVCLNYQAADGQSYQLNFIDTPGHVDFTYEVSRSLAACEGALLVVDAAQGVEAQSVANCYTAIDLGLAVVPVLNKIDLPSAEPEQVMKEIEEIIGIDSSAALAVSAKTGAGVEALLEQIITLIPPPVGLVEAPLRALIIDSWFDNYVGVVSLIKVVDGCMQRGQKIKTVSTGDQYMIDELGIFTPKRHPCQQLQAGEVGYVIAGIKNIHGAPVGDTLVQASVGGQALSGFAKIQPKVFAGLFPAKSDQFEAFRNALAKVSLNDAALYFEPESSQALSMGFRCGFLGMLHMEVIQQRLEREYGLDLISSAPTVVYEVIDTNDQTLMIDNPADLPPPQKIKEIREPVILASILTPEQYVGPIIQLCVEKRGVQNSLRYTGGQVMIEYAMPLREVVLDFHDRLKSISRGYASFDYRFSCYQAAPMVKIDILINGDKVDALSVIAHQRSSQYLGRELTQKMSKLIPQQMFEVVIQSAIGSKIIARSTVKALRKQVTAKCYGGDVTRKRKLLEKQKAGKKRMKQLGQVEIPQDAFMAVLKIESSRA